MSVTLRALHYLFDGRGRYDVQYMDQDELDCR